jgi:uncharacterized protein YoxC
MANDGALGAIERVDRALRRVEAAAERLRARAEDGELAARHRKLQDEVQIALASLDRLIGAVEAG